MTIAIDIRPSGTRFEPPARRVHGCAIATTPAIAAATSERVSFRTPAVTTGATTISGIRDIQIDASRLSFTNQGAVMSTGYAGRSHHASASPFGSRNPCPSTKLLPTLRYELPSELSHQAS